MTRLILFSILSVFIFSCNKKEGITYPSTMSYGDNVLAIDKITANKAYSFGASLEKHAALQIVMTNLSVQTNTSAPQPIWFFSDPQGWNAGLYGNGVQTFNSSKTGNIDMSITFTGSPGSCKVDYYEDTRLAKTKTLTW